MHPLKKAYYHLTAYVPRRLPRNEAEFMHFIDVLFKAYGVHDEPASWATIAGAVTSTPAQHIRKPWGHIANATKRLKINALAQSYRIAATQELQSRLEKIAKDEADKHQAKEALKAGLESMDKQSLA